MVESSAQPDSSPAPRPAVVELLGLLAYAELVSYFRLSADAGLAPNVTARAEVAGLAVHEYEHFAVLRDRLVAMDVDPESAMTPFIAALDQWHERTEPQSWLEGLVKAYVGDGIASDFYLRVADNVDPETRELVQTVLHEGRRAEFIVDTVRTAIAADPPLAARLALWARRLVGEALSQAQQVAAEHPELARLVSGDGEDEDNGEGGTEARVGRALAQLGESHTRRLKDLGLAS